MRSRTSHSLVGSRMARLSFKFFSSTNSLLLAVSCQDLDKVKELLNSGDVVDWKNKDGQYPILDAAVKSQDCNMIPLICKNGRFNDAHFSQRYMLQQVCSAGEWAVIDAFIDQGLTPPSLVIQRAFCLGKLSTVQLLVAKGFHRIHPPVDFSGYDHCCAGIVPIHWASYHGHCEIVRLLLEKDVDIEEKNAPADSWFSRSSGSIYSECTSLHLAALNGHTEIVELLLQHKAAIEAIDYDGNTPLLGVSYYDHEEVVRILLQYGADIEAVNENGSTALHRAILGEHEGIIKLLLHNGAVVEAIDSRGWTPLHHAAFSGNEAATRMLLEASANIKAANCHRRGPLHLACITRKSALAKLLLEKGADIEAKDKDGWTALHHAIAARNFPAVILLLENGARASTVATIQRSHTEEHEWLLPHYRKLGGTSKKIRVTATELAKLSESDGIIQALDEASHSRTVERP